MRFLLKVVTLGLLSAGVWGVVGNAPTAVAHGDEDHSQTETAAAEESTETTGAYEYVAPRGCSLSLLARRSLQLHDQANDDVTLSEAQIIYAETNIVRDLGPRLLEIDERVTIPTGTVADYAAKSQSLDETRLAAWQRYADQADFSIDEISPVSQTDESDQSEGDPTDEEQKDRQEESDEAGEAGSDDQPTAFWWLLGGAAVVGGLYYYWDKSRAKK